MREARGKPLPGRAFSQVPTRPCLCAEVQGRAPGGRRAGTQMPGPPSPGTRRPHLLADRPRPGQEVVLSFGCRGPGCVQCHPSAVGTPD